MFFDKNKVKESMKEYDKNPIFKGDTTEEKSILTSSPTTQEDWQWVEGFKATDLDLRCYGKFQYEVGKQSDITNDRPIKLCSNGFHFCKELPHVFYSIGNYYNCRYFKCKALVDVNSNTYKDYGKISESHDYYFGKKISCVLVAKSIILTEEIAIKDTYSDFFKSLELCLSLQCATQYREVNSLEMYLLVYKYKSVYNAHHHLFKEYMVSLGFSETFSTILHPKNFDIIKKFAKAMVDEGVSKDMAVYLILEKCRES